MQKIRSASLIGDHLPQTSRVLQLTCRYTACDSLTSTNCIFPPFNISVLSAYFLCPHLSLSLRLSFSLISTCFFPFYSFTFHSMASWQSMKLERVRIYRLIASLWASTVKSVASSVLASTVFSSDRRKKQRNGRRKVKNKRKKHSNGLRSANRPAWSRRLEDATDMVTPWWLPDSVASCNNDPQIKCRLLAASLPRSDDLNAFWPLRSLLLSLFKNTYCEKSWSTPLGVIKLQIQET